MFTSSHWEELISQGYTIVSRAIDGAGLRRAQDAANHLNAVHPEEGWERSRDESWREIRYCRHPDFLAVATSALDPLALEVLETAPTVDYVQFASTLPGFASKRRVGRHFHIDGGEQPSLGVFNVLLGVALTPIASDTVGGFHVLPGSHGKFAAEFGRQPTDGPVHWGQVKVNLQRQLLPEARMVVPRLTPGDVIVAHSFLAHGTSSNTSDIRRDMIFQRRAAAPLWEPATQEGMRQAFMRDPWILFRRR